MVIDHGSILGMEKMAVSRFKATCLAALERVRRTGRPLRVTRFGRPVADVVPTQPDAAPAPWLGAMKGRGRITGDLIAPGASEDDWDALR